MLFQIGVLTVERRPFNVSEWSRETKGDWAKKDLLGRAPGQEFVGEGEGSLKFKGRVLPTKYGGMSELELAHSMTRSGTPQFVVRGDGFVLGWYGLKSISESHTLLGPATGGVGQMIEHELELVPVGAPGAGIGTALLSDLISLFG
jgi:phage protein U